MTTRCLFCGSGESPVHGLDAWEFSKVEGKWVGRCPYCTLAGRNLWTERFNKAPDGRIVKVRRNAIRCDVCAIHVFDGWFFREEGEDGGPSRKACSVCAGIKVLEKEGESNEGS